MKKSGPPLQTEDEVKLVIDCLLLEWLVDALEHDLEFLKYLEMKMSDLYLRHLQTIQKHVIRDAVRVRAEMKRRGIRIVEKRETRDALVADYLCRGYSHVCSMWWGHFHAQAKLKLAAYLGIDLYRDGT